MGLLSSIGGFVSSCVSSIGSTISSAVGSIGSAAFSFASKVAPAIGSILSKVPTVLATVSPWVHRARPCGLGPSVRTVDATFHSQPLSRT